MDYSAHLEVAREAARLASAGIRQHYDAYVADPAAAAIGLELKTDNTPVTRADKEAEDLIRRVIGEAFPSHDFFGEETGRSGEASEFLWLVDPLDGTRGFVRQYPFFSTQVALMHGGEIVLGVSSAPVFEETAWALRGQGAWLNDKRVKVSQITTFEEATLSTGNLRSMASAGPWGGLGTIISQVARNRGYGDFYHYHLLAAGKIDLVIESDVNILDIAALSLIVTEAGGVFTDLHGAAPTLATSSVLAGTPALWRAARGCL